MTEIWEPEVKVITPAKMLGDAPSDAIILFNGKNLDQWVSRKMLLSQLLENCK
ncbi:MAG: hypothetical protein U5K54_24700 [Cytophagales bacterium]|nr:hypothetical protein [Cytophagales bacterium]